MDSGINGIRESIEKGMTSVGIELGSTRIKAVLIDANNAPVASGSYDWENSLIDNVWTYSLEDVWAGVQESFRKMAADVTAQYGVTLRTTGSIGISAMMHGYLAFDKAGNLLTPFRTWRNGTTGPASAELTDLFSYPIPQRWSIAHLDQAILNGEAHVPSIDYITTLAGYIHWKLTGRKVIGIGDASGMFPIDLASKAFNKDMIAKFSRHISSRNFAWSLENILPTVLAAGENAGELTPEGAKLFDVSGHLKAGLSFCPPEGDAQTGMVATNSVAVRTGNVSAGTSVFAMVVLEKELLRTYPEIDLVTTPDGFLVAMVHANNCTSDYDAWISLFGEAVRSLGFDVPKSKLYDVLLASALQGDPDCGGLLAYGYLSGENITKFDEGRPLFVRSPNSSFTLSNFMRVNLFTALGALRTGLDILFEKESVQIDEMRGHGGFFKTKDVGQKIMAAAINVPVSTMETAGEGGAWGIAVLASFMINRKSNESLPDFLNGKVFAGQHATRIEPDPKDVAGFNVFMSRYTGGLPIESAAVLHLISLQSI